MQVDFFKRRCRESTDKKRFGLCDDEDLNAKTPAYLDFTAEDKWIATVLNNDVKEITFTAIDHCVFVNSNEIDNPKRCDAMLEFDKTIILVELKNRKKKPAQISQLVKTIEMFAGNVDMKKYDNKKAFLSNKKKTVVLRADTKDKFLDDTGFRLYFSTVIEIK